MGITLTRKAEADKSEFSALEDRLHSAAATREAAEIVIGEAMYDLHQAEEEDEAVAVAAAAMIDRLTLTHAAAKADADSVRAHREAIEAVLYGVRS